MTYFMLTGEKRGEKYKSGIRLEGHCPDRVLSVRREGEKSRAALWKADPLQPLLLREARHYND